MNFLTKLEQTVHKWFKNLPHLPEVAKKWLGDNVWWLALIAVIISAISVLFQLVGLLANLSLLGAPVLTYYASSSFVTWSILMGLLSLVFTALIALIIALAITPLKSKQKKGWVLLFASLLVDAIWIVLSAILSLSIFTFIVSIVFGALFLGVAAYFVFEIHGEFAHVERSKGVKKAAKTA